MLLSWSWAQQQQQQQHATSLHSDNMRQDVPKAKSFFGQLAGPIRFPTREPARCSSSCPMLLLDSPWCHRVAPGTKQQLQLQQQQQQRQRQPAIMGLMLRARFHSPGEICASRQVRHDVMCQQLNSQRDERKVGIGTGFVHSLDIYTYIYIYIG